VRPLDKWDERFLKLSNEVASWSKDPSTQVGAVIAKEKHVLSLGFNGFPKGMRDDKYLYEDREIKYERVIHAEVNAVFNAAQAVKGCTIYVNRPPCANCSLSIIQAGIKRVVCEVDSSEEFLNRWRASMQKTKAFFEEAGVEYVEVLKDPN
jgi:dCMP deaminase